MTLTLDKTAWTRVALGDVAAASKEKVDPGDGSVDRYIAGEHMDTDELKVHRWGDPDEVDLGPAFHRRFRPGQVLYGSRRTYLRKVAVADFDGVCANTTFVVQTRDEGVLDQAFLPFVMSSEPFHAFAIAESKGSVNPYVNWSDIERFGFDLPPLDEQKRIADLLWAVERHRSDVLEVAKSASVASEIWVESTLAEQPTEPLATLVTMQPGRPIPSSEYGRGDLPLLRPGDMPPSGSTRWTGSSVKIPTSYADSYPDWVLEPGDLVINMTAQSLEDRFLGRVCRVHATAFLNQRIGRLRSESLDRDFLHAALRTRQFSDWVAQRSEGSKVKHMHWRHIAEFPLPVPSALEQMKIARGYESANRLVGTLHGEAASLEALRASLTAEIFGGA